MCQYFLNDQKVYDTDNYRNIEVLTYLALGNIYIENTFSLAGHRARSPAHASGVIGFITIF